LTQSSPSIIDAIVAPLRGARERGGAFGKHDGFLDFGLTFAAAVLFALAASGCGKHEGPGTIEGAAMDPQAIHARIERQADSARSLASRAETAAPTEQILFGDLHVHTTFSADAFMMSLPIMQGEGAHPIADACDFARYCSQLDFWSINDHAESLTPRRWRETKESIRQCNAVAGDPDNPDMVSFLGWEWTQIGRVPAEHYGHKNVIFRETAEDRVPRRPIHSATFASRQMRTRPPIGMRVMVPLLDWPNRQRYWDLAKFQQELIGVPDCPEGVDTRELPDDCLEGAATPQVLFEKLNQWGFDSLVIPHGTTWGLYTPAGSSWDKQLNSKQHDPERQRLVEIYSGHGNSEEYRDWRNVVYDQDGHAHCPEPSGGHVACCWQAGEIIRQRCQTPTSADCEAKVAEARANYLAAGVSGRLTIPDAPLTAWLDCDGCPDCFDPSMGYRPASSVQYMLALTSFEHPADPQHFYFGFIGSSDNHRARPGTGYKESGRLYNTEASGPRDRTWYERIYPKLPGGGDRSVAFDPTHTNVLPLRLIDFEREASYFMTGGLVAVHSEGRSRDQIWDALERREVYGTSGDRILLWFDLVNVPGGSSPMGSRVEMSITPRFRVRAAGSFKQLPGCPEASVRGLGGKRLDHLCHGECYNPSAERRRITRIEVVRVRRQSRPHEPVAGLIDDPWRVIPCPPDPAGCVVEFDDPGFTTGDREVAYYVRAIQEPTPAINAGGMRCERDENGRCLSVNPCYGDYRTPADDDCLSMNEERAWSSPVYVRPD
jgi:hypothetical protein